MAPELFNTMDARELVSLGQKIRDWQEAKKHSTNAMIKKFPDLGSDKTYRRICDDELEELDLEKQLERYRAVWALIEALETGTETSEELYEDLTPIAHLRRAFVETMRETSAARAIFMLIPSGGGKTQSCKVLAQKYGQRILMIEANELWNDNPSAMLRDMLLGWGVTEMPPVPVDRFGKVLERLNRSRTCLIIDEAHHMGPRCLNTVKTIINQSPGEVIMPALDTLWNRLERAAYEEVKQLTGNRLADVIRLGSISESDVAKLVTRRVKVMAEPANAGLLKQVVKLLTERAANKGNFRFVQKVSKRVLEKIEDTAGPDLECWTSAISYQLSRQ